jgi:hypothetical protein
MAKNVGPIQIAIATPQSDAKLRKAEAKKGATAFRKGLPRSTNPWNGGMLEHAWNEGYEAEQALADKSAP